MRRRTRIAAALAALAAALVAPSAAGTSHPAQCWALAVSPEFKQTRTVLCVRLVAATGPTAEPRLEIWVSKDAGRGWHLQNGTGLVLAGHGGSGTSAGSASHLTGALFSAEYRRDRTMYVAISNQGLLASTDDGDTWRLVDPAAVGSVRTVSFTPYLDPETLRAAERVTAPIAFLAGYAQTTTRSPQTRVLLPPSARLDPPAHTVADVPPVFATGLEFPPTRAGDLPGLFTGNSTDGSNPDATWAFEDLQTELYACRYDLSCPDLRYTFPDGEWVHVLASPSYARDNTLYAVGYKFGPLQPLGVDRSDFTLRISRDGGRTFHRWADLERAVAPIRAVRARPQVHIASDPAYPNRLVARVAAIWQIDHVRRPSDPPDEQVLVSDDRGRTWRRTAWRRYTTDGRSTGTLPWRRSGARFTEHGHTRPLIMTDDGRLFVQHSGQDEARDHEPVETYCSVDGGRRWTWPCAR